jgi:hypothetical protein
MKIEYEVKKPASMDQLDAEFIDLFLIEKANTLEIDEELMIDIFDYTFFVKKVSKEKLVVENIISKEDI